MAIGFNTEHLLLFKLNAGQAGYDETRAAQFYEMLRRTFGAVPGVRAATMTDMALVAESQNSNSIVFPGVPAPADRKPSTNLMLVEPSFFETMQIPILFGRPIDEHDTGNAPRAVVVNQVFARKFFPGRSPIGRHFAIERRTCALAAGYAPAWRASRIDPMQALRHEPFSAILVRLLL